MARGIDGAALDRYITGNYGEDQFRGLFKCSKCGELLCDQDNDTDAETGVCFMCRERTCDECGATWKAEDDDGGVDYMDDGDVPATCTACRNGGAV